MLSNNLAVHHRAERFLEPEFNLKGGYFIENIHKAHRLRLRKRFCEEGLRSFEPHQVLELLLTYAIPQKDVNPLAHDLLNAFGTIDKVFEAPQEKLIKIKGMGEYSATLIRLAGAISVYYKDSKNRDMQILDSTEKLGEFLIPKFLDKTVECTYLLSMDNRLNLLNCTMISEGSVTQTPFPLRKVMDTLLNFRATAAVIAHNHPNGFALPSSTDRLMTQELQECLKKIEVELLDHIIVSGSDFVSLRNSGMLNQY